ncbi:MAG: gliding motility-associated C-terminal domain-containing protein [Crocinitomicaceae bacterium]|nr:gliding motility-associated C-terminal domain-containing protein [Crocinitomicaceae bacterium]
MDPSALTCLQVDQNGDVTVNWTQSPDPTGSFLKYEIYTIQDGLVGTVNSYNTLSFLHSGAGADLNPKDYFVVTYSGCNGSVKSNSDTLQTIHLDLTNPANGTAILDWNQPGSWRNEWSSYFKIYMEYPAGTWILVDSVPFNQLQLIDTITICSAFLNYQIQLEHASGCVFTSNIEGDDFEDLIKPTIPIITAVSVDTSNNDVNISWNINPSEDTYGYIVYIQDDFGLWITLDTLWGITSVNYTHVGANADQKILHYSVAAFDSCFVAGITPPIHQTSAKSPEHFTMLLEADLNICEIAAILDWSEYDSWVNGVQNYEIYFTNTSNGIVEFADVTNSVQTTYTHTGLIRGETYCYYVRAMGNDGAESWSNRYCIYIDEPNPPGTNYLSTATVTQGNDVEVRILTEPASGIGALVLQRADDPAGPFEDIGSIIPASNQESIFDYTAAVEEQSYYYKIAVQDTCGDISTESNIAKTILLESQVDNDELVVTLSWNAYQGFDGSILQYNIYRGVDGLFSGGPIATTPPNVRAFQEDVSMYLNSQGSICYRVEAIESVNSYGIAETAFSNVECAELEPIVWVPSGFMKNGINNIFKPVISLFEFSSYKMVIFDRWGHIVFETEDYNVGWDGTLKNGKISPESTFVYMIEFQDAAGVTHISRGAVTFLIAEE